MSLSRIVWGRGGIQSLRHTQSRHAPNLAAAPTGNIPESDSGAHAPQWRSRVSHPPTSSAFLGMLSGRIPAIHVPRFVRPEHAQRFEAYLQPRLTPYSHIADPMVEKVGLAQSEFQAQSKEGSFQNRAHDDQDRYFSQAAGLEGIHTEIARHTGDHPWERVVRLLQDLLPSHDVQIARELDGRRYYAGIYRNISNSTPIHCDWAPYDAATEDWVINRVTHQAMLNIYLTPMMGGETVLYDRAWEEGLLRYQDPATYGYFREAVKGRASLALRPSVGDLYFFNTRCLHEVKAVGWEILPERGLWRRPRLTLSAFLGLLPAGVLGDRPTIILWS